jgi:adenylate cyclase
LTRQVVLFGASQVALQPMIDCLSGAFSVRCAPPSEFPQSASGLEGQVLLVAGETQSLAEKIIAFSNNSASKSLVAVIACVSEREGALRLRLLENQVSDVLTSPWSLEELRLRAVRAFEDLERRVEVTKLSGHIHKLSQYFSVDVVEKILSQSGGHHAYGENLEATIFFLDVRNFTTLSENVEPNLVAEVLNRLYTDIMDLILTYKGSVNKIIGDALLATFGCPVRGDRDAQNAVECALAIRDTMQLFNDTRPEYLKEKISIGMGIATGRVFAGTIGSYRKMDYTVIGDTVNIAARLEGLTKQTRFDLIIDKNTREAIGDRLLVKKLQVTRVRGRTQPMEIFLVEGLKETAAGTDASTIFFKR